MLRRRSTAALQPDPAQADRALVRCSTCHRDRRERYFIRKQDGARGKTCSTCREKQAARQRARAAADPEAYRAASRARAKESKARQLLQRKQRPRPRIVLDMPWDGPYEYAARLYHADALDVLERIERPDLIVTDPPYGIGLKHKKLGKIAGDENMDVGYEVLALAIRRLKPGGHVYAFGDRKKAFDLERAGGRLIRVLEPLIWNKQTHGTGDCSRTFGPSWEYISVGERVRTEGDEDTDGADRRWWPMPSDRLLHLHQADRDRKRRPGVLHYKRARPVKQGHPTPKPLGLLRELIGVSSNVQNLVLDPFAGSGSTGEAARQMGRRFVGMELMDDDEQPFARLAAERIAAAKYDPDLAWAEEVRWYEHLVKLGQDPWCHECRFWKSSADCPHGSGPG